LEHFEVREGFGFESVGLGFGDEKILTEEVMVWKYQK